MADALILDSLQVGVLRVNGAVYLPPGSITNDVFDPTSPLDQGKVGLRLEITWSQLFSANAAAERRVIHRARKAGVLSKATFGAGVAATVDATATIQIRKNGTNFLSSAVVIDVANTAFSGTEDGSPNSAGVYAAGDVFEIDVSAVSAGSGALPKGLFATLIFDESPI